MLFISTTYALDLQLLGGVWILQTFPAIVIGLYTGWCHRWALMAGWAVGMAYGSVVAFNNPKVGDPGSHFGSPLNEFPFTETLVYIGFTALLLNLLVTVALTFLFRALNVSAGVDQTSPEDYRADIGDEGVEEELDPLDTPPTRSCTPGDDPTSTELVEVSGSRQARPAWVAATLTP